MNPNYALFSINVVVPTWLSWNADDKDGALMLWHRSWDMRVGFGRPQFMTGLKIQHRRWPGRIYSQKISLRHFYIGKIYCQKGSVLYLHVVQIAAYWTSTDFGRYFEFRYILQAILSIVGLFLAWESFLNIYPQAWSADETCIHFNVQGMAYPRFMKTRVAQKNKIWL